VLGANHRGECFRIRHEMEQLMDGVARLLGSDESGNLIMKVIFERMLFARVTRAKGRCD
jgi:hypothetical protein